MITQQNLTEIASIIEANKPYLLAIEGEVQRIKHGEVTIRVEIRNGNVEKMQLIDAKRTWLREKARDDTKIQGMVVMGFVNSIQPV